VTKLKGGKKFQAQEFVTGRKERIDRRGRKSEVGQCHSEGTLVRGRKPCRAGGKKKSKRHIYGGTQSNVCPEKKAKTKKKFDKTKLGKVLAMKARILSGPLK